MHPAHSTPVAIDLGFGVAVFACVCLVCAWCALCKREICIGKFRNLLPGRGTVFSFSFTSAVVYELGKTSSPLSTLACCGRCSRMYPINVKCWENFINCTPKYSDTAPPPPRRTGGIVRLDVSVQCSKR